MLKKQNTKTSQSFSTRETLLSVCQLLTTVQSLIPADFLSLLCQTYIHL